MTGGKTPNLDEIYQLENKMKYINKKTNKQKMINFVLTLGRSTRAKNAPRIYLKYLKDRIFKIKQYLDYILMTRNKNILATLRTSLNLQINYKKLNKKQISTAATT